MVWAVVLSPWIPLLWVIIQDANPGRPIQPSKLAIALAVVLVLVLAIYWNEAIANNEVILFLIQTLAGNWGREGKDVLHDNTALVLSAAIALALNVGAFAAILTTLGKVYKIERKETMKVATVLSLRDSLIRDSLFELLSRRVPGSTPDQWEADIRKAFSEANEAWSTTTLEVVLGRDAATDFLSAMQRDVSSSIV